MNPIAKPDHPTCLPMRMASAVPPSLASQYVFHSLFTSLINFLPDSPKRHWHSPGSLISLSPACKPSSGSGPAFTESDKPKSRSTSPASRDATWKETRRNGRAKQQWHTSTPLRLLLRRLLSIDLKLPLNLPDPVRHDRSESILRFCCRDLLSVKLEKTCPKSRQSAVVSRR